MKFLLTALICFILSQQAYPEHAFPSDITSGFANSELGESGGLFIRGPDRQRFIEYIRSNWKDIVDNIESLPAEKGQYDSKNAAFAGSVMVFGAACEDLPPTEYLEFLGKFVELREQNRISYSLFENQLRASSAKQDFLAVNWEHPEVELILARARTLIPNDDTVTLKWIDKVSRGDLADNYMTNRSKDAPLPETLPGIKLVRPWASLIEKYEILTGTKIPSDQEFRPRPPKRATGQPKLATQSQEESGSLSKWYWVTGCLVALISIFGVLRSRLNSGKGARSF